MKSVRVTLLAFVTLPWLTGCETLQGAVDDVRGAFGRGQAGESRQPAPPSATTPSSDGTAARQNLGAGIAHFEAGRYTQAQQQLRDSLDQGLPSRTEKARAHKYLAFTYCVTGRTLQCRQEFTNALAADPGFDLSPAERGHPSWGPVFQSVSQRK